MKREVVRFVTVSTCLVGMSTGVFCGVFFTQVGADRLLVFGSVAATASFAWMAYGAWSSR